MTTYTVSGIATLPNDTTPLAGTWYVSVYATPAAAVDADGSFRAGVATVTTDTVTGAASVTLPETTGDALYEAYFKSADRQVALGPYQFTLTANRTWGAIITAPSPLPASPVPADTAIANHIANPTGAHAATAISGLDAAVGAYVGLGTGTTGPALDARFIKRTAAHTDGRVIAWSATTGDYVEAAPSGARLIASARNTTGTITSATTTGGLGTAVAVPGTAISVTDSAGLPVLVTWSGYWAQTLAGDGLAVLALYETTSTPTLLNAAYNRLPNSTASPIATFDAALRMRDIGVVTTTRTFQVYAQIWTASGVSATAALYNTSQAPTMIRAATGV